ncbi:hypothetical protein E9549_17525 [Blastococcus sp. MG754426]|uniref:hypothetical protein n=1 Tax=unclassified Blastococcus TaxID=2619396 RepID=UPI001EF04D9D|nr:MULTISPECIES: hypothetical protein [unclassified Blastococcus]MCF6509188.1 hypothetical protein [Blastococcus sp. MG754426]MCF6513721.1 hypothetical protein [Blastococcus sp. MG754427]
MTPLAADEDAAVRDAIGALEIAEGIVPTTAFMALREPALRRVVADRLAACGRVLIPVDQGWVSGYDDAVANALVSRGYGTVCPVDRAVLALVLLRTVAIPRARGEVAGEAWVVEHGARPTSIDELAQNRHLTKAQITTSVRRLRTLGLLRPGHRADLVPGPALLRLTRQRTTWLWEDLLLLAAPDSPYAHALRARRAGPSGADAAVAVPAEEKA